MVDMVNSIYTANFFAVIMCLGEPAELRSNLVY